MATKIAFEGSRELRWLEIWQYLACYMESEVEFADQQWDEWLEAVRRPSIMGLVICSWGPTQPTHQQWRRATRLMRERELPVAVITEARHNFALAKAASWLGTNISASRWESMGEALALLGLESGARVTMQATLVALRDRFGAVTTDPELEQVVTTSAASQTGATWVEVPASSDAVVEANEEIQQKLAEVQARFQKNRAASARA